MSVIMTDKAITSNAMEPEEDQDEFDHLPDDLRHRGPVLSRQSVEVCHG